MTPLADSVLRSQAIRGQEHYTAAYRRNELQHSHIVEIAGSMMQPNFRRVQPQNIITGSPSPVEFAIDRVSAHFPCAGTCKSRSSHCPGGTCDNSPTFQRWERRPTCN